jgi:Chaperone of endosialidase
MSQPKIKINALDVAPGPNKVVATDNLGNVFLGNATATTLTLSANPTLALQAATKAYVDAATGGGGGGGGGDALTTNPLSQFAATTSAQLAGVMSDETGTGALVFANSPALAGTPTTPTAAANTNTTQIASTAFVITERNTREPVITAGTVAQYYRGDKTFQPLNAAAVGLGNVNNTSDVNKPVSTAVQTVLDTKQADLQFQNEGVNLGTAGDVSSVNFTGAGVTASRVGNAVTVDVTGGGAGAVTSVTGTTNQITASPTLGDVILTIPSTFVAPGSIQATTSMTVGGLTSNSFIYTSTGGLLATTAPPTDGQLLIGSTTGNPVNATLTSGAGISIANGPGSITVSSTITPAGSTNQVQYNSGGSFGAESGFEYDSSSNTLLVDSIVLPNTGAYRAKTFTGTINDVLTITSADVLQIGSGSQIDRIQLFGGTNGETVIVRNGQIGIGVNSPTAPVHIEKPSATINLNATDNIMGASVIQFNRASVNNATIGVASVTGAFIGQSTPGDLLFRSTGNMLFSTNDGSTTALNILSNGNVGIGTNGAAQSVKFHVTGNARIQHSTPASPSLQLGGGVAGGTTWMEFWRSGFSNSRTGYLGNVNSGVNDLQLTSEGGDLLLTNGGAVTVKLTPTTVESNAPVTSSSLARGIFQTTADYGGTFGSWNSRSSALQVQAASNGSGYQIFRATHGIIRDLAGLDVFAGGSTTSDCIVRLHVSNSSSGGLGFSDFDFNGNGNFTAPGDLIGFSDAKLKTNVVQLSDALRKVNLLRGVQFDRTDTGQRGIGLIAQEVQSIVPEVVKSNDDGTLGVAYGNLVGLLIEAIKELTTQVQNIQRQS